MVPSNRRFGFSEAAALFPWAVIFGLSLLGTMERDKDKVMAGGNPGQPRHAG